MKIAILGGGLAGLSAAYELAQYARAGLSLDVSLFEAGPRLGGLLETHRQSGFVIECGADSWVTEKPWARALAVELGLEQELIGSCDTWRRTFLLRNKSLIAMPDGMRMMVPVNWSPLLASPLFSTEAKLAYLREPRRAEELKSAYATHTADESVSDFVARHFGNEIATNIAAPLLSGVFGGDIRSLSAQAVMPAFVRMAREQGSLVLALQQHARAAKENSTAFTSLRNGLGTLPERITAALPPHWLHLHSPVTALEHISGRWRVHVNAAAHDFDAVIIATPAPISSQLLSGVDATLSSLLQMDASSAIIVALAFAPADSRALRIPRGFGFLVPQPLHTAPESSLMAATFVDQKFPHRVPEGGVLLRGFFGGASALQMLSQSDDAIIALAHSELSRILGTLPAPHIALVRRWPHSLPQYAVGHLHRVAQIERAAAALRGLRLTGNAFHGVGMPDIVREGRIAAATLLAK